MTGAAPHGPDSAARHSPRVLTLKHVPPTLDDEPAYRDDPLMDWSHRPEPPHEGWLPKQWLREPAGAGRSCRH